MIGLKSKKPNNAPRHLNTPEPPRRAARAEKTAAHRGRKKERPAREQRSASEPLPAPESQEYSGKRLYEEKLLPYAEERHRANQRSLRACLGWLFALPLILLVIQKLTGHSKIGILLAWILGMFIISAAVVYIAYSDHELQTYLRSLAVFVPEAEEKSLGSLLPVDKNGNWTVGGEPLRHAFSPKRGGRKSGEASARLPREPARKPQQHGEEGRHEKRTAPRP